MRATPRSSVAPVVAALGGLALLAALWEPFYRLTFPASLLDRLARLSSQFGALGPALRQGTTYLRNAGALDVTPWQAFHQIDALLLVAAVAAFCLGLLALTERARGAGPVIGAVGAAASALVIYRMADRVAPSEILHLGWGAYLALTGTLTIAAAGALMARAERLVEPESPPAIPWAPPVPHATAHTPGRSVAPPGL